MYGIFIAAHTFGTVAEQQLVGRIDNGIHLHFCYIVSYYFKRHRCTSFESTGQSYNTIW